jgi:uncharacterized paraquat-inducible protein A
MRNENPVIEEIKQKLTECANCPYSFDWNRRVCPNCNFEIREAAAKRKLPLMFYPLVLMFGLYLLWEGLLKGFSSSP